MAGFESAEGHFFVEIKKSSSMKIGYQIILISKITQHVKDEQLMKNLATFMGCGRYYKKTKRKYRRFPM